MPVWDTWNFGAEEDPEYRKRAVTNKLFAPLGIALDSPAVIGGVPEDPAVTERKAREVRERLAAQDRMFGNYWGASLGGKRVTAGDADADGLDDADAELASLEQARR